MSASKSSVILIICGISFTACGPDKITNLRSHNMNKNGAEGSSLDLVTGPMPSGCRGGWDWFKIAKGATHRSTIDLRPCFTNGWMAQGLSAILHDTQGKTLGPLVTDPSYSFWLEDALTGQIIASNDVAYFFGAVADYSVDGHTSTATYVYRTTPHYVVAVTKRELTSPGKSFEDLAVDYNEWGIVAAP